MSVFQLFAARTPFVDSDGRLTTQALKALQALVQATGGNASGIVPPPANITIIDIEADLTAITAQIESLEDDVYSVSQADLRAQMALDAVAAVVGSYGDSVEHDFGTTPVYDASFTITDASISASSVILVTPGGAATGRTADDWQWDGATVGVDPGAGTATCYVTFHPGPIVGPRSFNYTVI